MPRILVVDDEPFIQRTLTLLLERAGYSVAIAADGQAAIASARRLHPELMFVDAVMPGADGYSVCSAIRSDSSIHPQPHIIMLTGRQEAVDRRRASDAGADEYMVKPFSPLALLARVRDIVPAQELAVGMPRPAA